MAEMKYLNTRVQLKYDTLAKWTEKNPTLLAGELAIVSLGNSHTTTTPDNGTHAILFKVGPGAFNSLPFASALAADVYGWAKLSEAEFVDSFLSLKATDGSTLSAKLDGVFATNQQLADAIAEVREEITNLSVSALETRVKTIEETYETKENVKKVADDLGAYKESNNAALAGVKETADAAVTDAKLATTLEPYAKTDDVVTTEKFSVFESANTQAIANAKSDAEDTAARALSAAKGELEDKITTAQDRADDAYDMAEATKSRVNTFLDGEGVADTVDSLKEIQDELERLGDAVELEAQFAAKADKVTGAVAGNFAGLDANGNLVDSGKKAADFAPANIDTGVHTVVLASGTNNGTVKLTVDGIDTDNVAVTGLGSAAFTEAGAYEVAGAAAAAQSAAEGKVTELANNAVAANTQGIADINAILEGHGDIVTHNAAEFATAAQGLLANSALQDADVHALGKSGDLYDSINIASAKDSNGEDVPCFVFYCGTASDLV